MDQLSSQTSTSENPRWWPTHTNVGETERLISILAGGALAIWGLTNRSKSGLGLAVLGGGLIFRGTTGYCSMYNALGMNTSGPRTKGSSLVGNDSIKVEKSVVINCSREKLYRFWRKLDNLPNFMHHLERVEVQDDRRSHWVAKGPAGHNVEWDAEIINERENELIAWRSLPGSEVDNAGSVRFETDPSGRGTIVKIALMYNPPAGKLGALVARMFGEEPHMQIQEDLHRFKDMMETGDLAGTSGQSFGKM